MVAVSLKIKKRRYNKYAEGEEEKEEVVIEQGTDELHNMRSERVSKLEDATKRESNDI